MFKVVVGKHNDPDEFEPGPYGNGRMQFTIAHVKRKTITMCADFHTCREVLIANASSAVLEIDSFEGYTLNKSFTSLLFLYTGKTPATSKKYIYNAVKLVNLFEDDLGWAKTIMHSDLDNSSIKMCNFDEQKVCVFKKGKHNMFLTIGPKQWLKAPHLMSLYTLIMRLSTVPGMTKAKSLYKFNSLVDKYYKQRNKYSAVVKKDLQYYHNNKKKITLILNNYTELFAKRAMKYVWDAGRFSKGAVGVEDIDSEGINILCSGKTMDRRLRRKLQKICAANNIAHNTSM